MARWLKTLRAIYALDQDELAKYIGKSRSAVAMYERGSPIPIETIALIRSTFTDAPAPPVTNDMMQIAGSAVADDRMASIRYAGVVPCSDEWGDPLSSTEVRSIEPKFAGRNRFMCQVTGDSCYPALQQGDLTVWESDRNPSYGVIVLAERLDDQACTVKELRYDGKDRRNNLVPINPEADAPSDDRGWQCCARLVGVIRRASGPERTWFFEAGLRPRHLLED